MNYSSVLGNSRFRSVFCSHPAVEKTRSDADADASADIIERTMTANQRQHTAEHTRQRNLLPSASNSTASL
jgi:hypothetical protein